MLTRIQNNNLLFQFIDTHYEKDFWNTIIQHHFDSKENLDSFIKDFGLYNFNRNYNDVVFWNNMKHFYHEYFLATVDDECDAVCGIFASFLTFNIDLDLENNPSPIPIKYLIMTKYLNIKTKDLMEDIYLIKDKIGLLKFQAVFRGYRTRWEIPCFTWSSC